MRKKILRFLFGPAVISIEDIGKEKRSIKETISFRDQIADLFVVMRNTGFVLVPALLAGAIFLFLPQGRDTLLLVLEKIAIGDYRQLGFFLLSVVLWSMAAEFSVRYGIAITDNSGKSLRDSRVLYRKLFQRFLAAFSLYWPGLMTLAALVWCFFTATYMDTSAKTWSFSVFGGSLIIILRVLSWLYNDRLPRQGNLPAQTRLGARSVSPSEYDWINRLYGIYNEYVYTMPKPTNFVGKYRKKMSEFSELTHNEKEHLPEQMPQSSDVMAERRLVPEKFELINGDVIGLERGDAVKWRYYIPNSFFPVLHRQLAILTLISVGLMLVIAFIPADLKFFEIIGAPALVCLAFACYSGIYCGLLYLDFAKWRNNPFAVRWMMLVLVLVFSWINHDHPVNMGDKPSKPRNTLTTQFNGWFKNYKTQMDSTYGPGAKYPVLFVCAEGGAFRTGAYTSVFLAELQRRLYDDHVAIKRSIFSMSGVSGGALGLSYYNASAFGPAVKDDLAGSDADGAVKFYQYDCLSPLIGKMFFGEFVNLFIPTRVPVLDRATALEDAWSQAFYGIQFTPDSTRFRQNFIDGRKDIKQPVLIINTTEVESGYQCWISNVEPKGLLYQRKRDLLLNKVNNVSYATATNFSTRFPLFSPGAEIDTIGGRFHYLDGGYVENTGAGSTLEELQILSRNCPDFKRIIPIVIYLRFSTGDNSGAKNIRFLNEFQEIGLGIYNTRVGRSFTAIAQLNHFVRENNGFIIDEPLSADDKAIPMNWMLSRQSINNVKEEVNTKLKAKDDNAILVRLFRDDLHYLKPALGQ